MWATEFFGDGGRELIKIFHAIKVWDWLHNFLDRIGFDGIYKSGKGYMRLKEYVPAQELTISEDFSEVIALSSRIKVFFYQVFDPF